MANKHYIILAVVAYLLFLLITTPAAPVLAYVQKQAPGTFIQGVTGTVWKGNAQYITINNKFKLAQASWSFVFWRLLTGEAGVDLQATYNDNPLNAYIGVDVTGSLVAHDVNAWLDAYEFGKMANLPLGELSGDIVIDLDQLSWDNTGIPVAYGTINWNSAVITVAEEADLGNITITLTETDSEPLSADIKNKGGQLSLNGSANINHEGVYNIDLSMRPTESAGRNLERSLAMFAKKQTDGNYTLKNTGNLKQLGLM